MKLRSLLIALALLCHAPAARAATPEPLARTLQGEAREAYEAARGLFRSGDYLGALAQFEHAYATTPDPRLLWNMAACERKLGHDARVLSLVARYLVDGASMLTDDDRREAERFVAAVRTRVAVLTVATDPGGAHVRVDGAVVGDTPLVDPVFLDPGTHHVEVAKEGYQTIARDETVAASERRSLALVLQPAPAEPAPPPETPPESGGVAIEATPPPPSPAVRPPPPETRAPVAAYVTGGAGLVAVGVGVALVLDASSSYDQLKSQCAPSCDRSAWSGARTREIAGDVLLGAGAVAFGVGIVLWSTSRSDRSVGLSVTPAGALVRGTW